MTAGSDPRNEPLSPEEQALAQRLAQWKTGEPDAALDRIILAQARSAVSTEAASPIRRPGRRPWLVGLASAATFVFAVGLVWRVAEQAPEPLAEMARGQEPAVAADESVEIVFMEPSAPIAPLPSPPAPPAPAADVDVSGGAVADAASLRRQNEGPARSARKVGEVEPSIPSRPTVATPAPPPTIATAPRSAPVPAEAPLPIAEESVFAAPPAPPPPPPVPEMPTQAVSSPEAPAPELSGSASRARAATDSTTTAPGAERMDTGRAMPTAPPSAAAVSPADPFPAEPAPQRNEHREQAHMRDYDLEQAPADFRRAVERIRRLIADDKPERALGAIERLRQRHPERDLPEDLRRFLASRAGQNR